MKKKKLNSETLPIPFIIVGESKKEKRIFGPNPIAQIHNMTSNLNFEL